VNPATDGWHSAGDLGLFECAEPEPWDRKIEYPQDLEVSASQRAQRVRRARERDERGGGAVLLTGTPTRGLARTMIAPPSFDAPERSKPVPAERPDRIGRKKIGVFFAAAQECNPPAAQRTFV
jgi:hypothetical protein